MRSLFTRKICAVENTQKGMIRMSKIKRYSFSPLIENTEKSILKQSKSLIPQKKEMGTLMNLLTSVHPPIESITIGHGR